jgi:ABC-type phosphate transport system auxiliary subunit
MAQESVDTAVDRRSAGALERHIQTMVQAALLAVLLWIGGTVVDVRDRVNRMEERAIALSSQVEDMRLENKRTTDDRWRGADHREYARHIDTKFSAIEKMIEKLEGRLSSMELPNSRRK